jgi:acyl-CoA synthetase (AMP-forming)/AMP-acid ligase II
VAIGMREPPLVAAALHGLREYQPDRPLFTFVDESGQPTRTLDVRTLTAAAEGIARSLRTSGLAPGDRAVLVYPPSLDFVTALVGCLVAGVLPVPVCPPDPLSRKADLAAFAALVADCGARVALTNRAYDRVRTLGAVTARLDRGGSRWPDLAWQRTDRRMPDGSGTAWYEPASPDEPALLQYTSGSTSAPRGVVITHRNLAHEVAANTHDLELGPHARAVSWLPHYHDFGLISVILSTLAGNAHSYLMSPLTFLRRPAVWFDVMSRVKATHTAAPNFAFDLAVRKTTPEQRRRWDLRAMRYVMCAAEPIRPATVEDFYTAFAPAGLARETFYPAYGLAEHTVSVTMGGRATLRVDRADLEQGRAVPAPPGRPAITVLGCGRLTKPDARLRIVDPQTRQPLPDGHVGEILVDSPTKGAGYFGKPVESRETFHAQITGEEDPRGYLRTGDLGFRYEGELFVTGRHKDLVVLRGHNFYPQDLEESVRDCHPLVRPGGLAAFSVPGPDDRGEHLVILVETRDDSLSTADAQGLVTAVRRAVWQQHQVACDTVVLARPGTVHKTTSGKVRRGACRQAYLDGELATPSSTILISTEGGR